CRTIWLRATLPRNAGLRAPRKRTILADLRGFESNPHAAIVRPSAMSRGKSDKGLTEPVASIAARCHCPEGFAGSAVAGSAVAGSVAAAVAELAAHSGSLGLPGRGLPVVAPGCK